MQHLPSLDRASGSGALTLIKRIRRFPAVALVLAMRGMIAEERNVRATAPFARRLMLWRRGFTTSTGTLYGFPRGDMAEYLSTFAFHFARNRINGSPELFADKLVLRTFLLSMGFRQAETLALRAGGRILLDPFGSSARTASPAELDAEIARRGGRYVVKPAAADQGSGVYLLTSSEGRIVRRGSAGPEPWSAARFPARGAVIIERWVEPAAFWRELFTESGNTIRLLTLWTPGEPAPFLARAAQRVGTKATAPTDNLSRGGIAATVDLETGELAAGRMLTATEPARSCRFTSHPDSGARIEGATLPYWSKIKAVILQAASRFPMNPWIGWDVLVHETGAPVIIEGNAGAGVRALQLDAGMLRDPRIREFFEKSRLMRRKPIEG